MAVQVTQPNINRSRQVSGGNNDLNKLLTLGGAVAGGILGGPQGALSGASAGGMLGGLFGEDSGPSVAAPKPEAQIVETGASDALSRRMQAISNSNISQIREGINSLKFIEDPNQRLALAKPLLQAEYLAKG